MRPGGAGDTIAARTAAVLGALGLALLVAIVPVGAAVAAPESPVEILPPVAVGDGAYALAVSPDGATAYVVNYWDQTVSVIDTATNTELVPPVPVAINNPLGEQVILVHPDGRVLILDGGDGVSGPAIVEIDPATWTAYEHALVVPAPWTDGLGFDFVLTPDGSKVYVSDYGNGAVLAADIPAIAGPGDWAATAIIVTGAVTPDIIPGSLAIAGGRLYALDLVGEDSGNQPTGAAVIRTADDVLEPTVIGYTAPAGTVDGILSMPRITASPDGSTVIIAAAAELDPSGDIVGFFWSIPGGTVPATATYLGQGLGSESASVAFAPSGETLYVIDCACDVFAWTLDVAGGAGVGTEYDLSAATDLDFIIAVAASPDGTRLYLTGEDTVGDSRLWQLSLVTDDALSVAGPATADQGGSVTLAATALDNSGNPIDVTTLATFTSSVATDVVSGNVVTFPHASPHTITATYRPLPSLPPVAVGAITVEVRAMIPPTGVEDPRPWLGGAAALLLVGAALVLTRSRLRRS